MRFAKLWEKLLGVEATVVEGVVFDEDEEVIVASVRPRVRPDDAGSASAAAPATARGTAADGGARWTWGPSRRTWRRTHHGLPAPPTVWWWPRCPGLATTPATPGHRRPQRRRRRGPRPRRAAGSRQPQGSRLVPPLPGRPGPLRGRDLTRFCGTDIRLVITSSAPNSFSGPWPVPGSARRFAPRERFDHRATGVTIP